MSALMSLLLLLQAAPVPTCRTADLRLEQLIAAKAAELQGAEHCQSRLYHTLHDVDGDGADDFVLVFTVEGVDVEEGVIVLRTSEYEKNDPECCPSGKGELRYTFLRGKLLAAEGPRPRPRK